MMKLIFIAIAVMALVGCENKESKLNLQKKTYYTDRVYLKEDFDEIKKIKPINYYGYWTPATNELCKNCITGADGRFYIKQELLFTFKEKVYEIYSVPFNYKKYSFLGFDVVPRKYSIKDYYPEQPLPEGLREIERGE